MAKTNKIYGKKNIDPQINRIVSDVAEIFVEDTKGELNINFFKLSEELKKIVDNIEIVQKQYSNSKGEIKNILTLKKNGIKKKQLLLKGYVILQNFRKFLTGSLTDYRYYTTDNEGNVVRVTLTEEEILKYLTVTGRNSFESTFSLSNSLDTLAKKIERTDAEIVFLDHFNNLYNLILIEDMQKLETYGFMVHSKIINEFGSAENKTPTNLWTAKGKYAIFNRGHLFEGLDISFYETLGSFSTSDDIVKNYNKQKIRMLFFTKNLNLDNVSGFKGGDNTFTNTQIKSTGADLMDFNTIYKYIKNLYNALQLTDGGELKKTLSNLFIDETEKSLKIKIEDTVINNILEGFNRSFSEN